MFINIDPFVRTALFSRRIYYLPTAIAHSNWFTELALFVGQRSQLLGAGLAEDLAAVAAMML